MKHKRLVVVALGAGALGYGLARGRRLPGTLDEPDHCGIGRRGSPGMVEFETEDVDAAGNLVVDDLVVAVDSDGEVIATDETVAVITPEGDTVVDEKLSVVGRGRRAPHGRRGHLD